MESPRHNIAPNLPSPSQALPSIAALTNGLPATSQQPVQAQKSSPFPARDSGAWLGTQSKHSSLNNGFHVSTLLNPEDSQVRASLPSTPTSSRLSHPYSILPSINQNRDSHPSQRDSATRYSSDYYNNLESRRSSVDSRVHSGLGNLKLTSAMSPYESQHASQVSLAASLRRPEGQAQPSPSIVRPHVRSQDQHSSTRVAPPIVPNPRQYGAPDPTSAKPTQGFPWAFPDSAMPLSAERTQGRASSSESDESEQMSRQNSYAASSVRSSVFSNESALPSGQRRFEGGMAFQKIIGTAPEAVGLEADPEDASSHHHSMQHRSITALQNEHASPGHPSGYSRTPELRVSHKLAERKRRSEMKDLFEDLNKAVPSNGGAKASKWEILSKAIDHIRSARAEENAMHSELQRLRTEVDYAQQLHKENEQMRTEVCVMHEHLRRLEPNTHHVYGAYTSHLTQHQGQVNNQHQSVGALPPTQASHVHQAPSTQYASLPQAAPMQGIEYALPSRSSYEVR